MNYQFAPGTERRAKNAREHYMSIDGELPVVNTFQFLAPISGSYRFFVIACFENSGDAIEKGINAHKIVFKEDKPQISSAVIRKVLKGYLPIRNTDVRKDYKVVKWEE